MASRADNNLMYRSTDGGDSLANTYTSATFDGAGYGLSAILNHVSRSGAYWRHKSWGEPAAFRGVHFVYSQHGLAVTPGDIYYIRSTDSGVTFATPFKLNTDATTRPQWQPNLSVSPSGTLLATWYDAREFPNCVMGTPNMPCYRM